MDPLSTLQHHKVLDEDTQRDKQLNAIVAQARRLRPKKRYPKMAEMSPAPAAPAAPVAPAATPPVKPPAPPMITPELANAVPPLATPGAAKAGPPAAAKPPATGGGINWQSIGSSLQRGGQYMAKAVGAGDWYNKQSPFMQQWGMPVGGPLAALLGAYLMSRMFRKQGSLTDMMGSSPAMPGITLGGTLGSATSAGLSGASTGAALGMVPGALVGMGRGNIPEGVGRGVLRGGAAGAGAGIGVSLASSGLAAAMQHNPQIAKLLQDNPQLAVAALLASGGVGGLAGYSLGGKAIGPAERDREPKLGMHPGTGIPDATGEKAWGKKKPIGVAQFAAYESSDSLV